MTLRFDDALEKAGQFLARNPDLGVRRLLVRDLQGRIRIFIASSPDASTGLDAGARDRVKRLSPDLHRELGAWSPGEAHVLCDMAWLLRPDAVWASEDALHLDTTTRRIERTLLGSDWLRGPLHDAGPIVPRATLFGLKGGVGRSTALAVWAQHLAEDHGKKVLIVDLDLEAPGLGQITLPERARPDFGVIDWFVESAVGQGDAVLERMAGHSALAEGGPGEVLVVPAAGARTGRYLPKLARAYQGDPTAPSGFGARLATLVDALEKAYTPDVVLLDSRAGLHDVAAVALTRLDALCLLFAIDTPQTWSGYRLLFEHWRDHYTLARTTIDHARRNLKFVAGQVPETDRTEYLSRFNENAWSLLNETLYEWDLPDRPNDDPFTYDLADPSGPHSPLPVYWSRVFQDYDPIGRPAAVSRDQLMAAYGVFVRGATALLLEPT